MNIEIANRLVELRKKNGLSQEELADKLGLSRQAVSKWERAESSPDTDNLICLAKLYNISLDDLLNTDQSLEELSKEVKEKEEEEKDLCDMIEERLEKKAKEKVEGRYNHLTEEEKKRYKVYDVISSTITGSLFIAAAIVYFLISSKDNTQWAKLWIVFLAPIVIASILDCLKKRRFTPFAYPVAITIVFFILGLYFEMWHPGWIIFLTVPIYYIIFDPIDKAIASRRNEAKDPEDDPNEDDEDDDEDDDD